MDVYEVIRTFIEYKGFRQGLFTDYGSVFDYYLNKYQKDLSHCSMFEFADKENALTIRYKNNKYIIYHTDERAALWGVEYTYDNAEDATGKFLELYSLSNR